MDAAKVGAHLASLRRAREMTQQDVAEILHISNKAVSKWESGGGFPEITILPALAELYGVTADEILAGESLNKETEPSWRTTAQERRKYFLDRAEVRFDIGVGAAVLLALIGLLIQFYAVVFLPVSVLALWVGWRLTEGTLRQMEPGPDLIRAYKRRYRGLLLAEAPQIWLALPIVWMWSGLMTRWLATQPGQLFAQMTSGGLTQHLLLLRYLGLPGLDALLAIVLLPVPAMVLVLQSMLRRKAGPDAELISKSAMVIFTVFLGLFMVTVIWRSSATLPVLERLSQVDSNNYMKRAQVKALLAHANAPFLLAEWLLFAGTAAALAAGALRGRIGKKADGDACAKS